MHRRTLLQQGVHGCQHGRALRVVLLLDLFQRHRAVQRQVAHGDAAQSGQVRAAAQRFADVLGQRADIGALAARHPHRERRGIGQGAVQQRD